MSVPIESQAQSQRDLRSAQQDYKRGKDSQHKWSHGARPLAGCRIDWVNLEAVGGTEHQRAKTRPRVKNSEISHYKKPQNNVSKMRPHWASNQGRLNSTMQAREQIKDPLSQSLMDLIPSEDGWRKSLTASEDWKYSFDNTVSPNRPLTLDVFVKTSGRETERMVEKEYEILNENGQVLKGRRARQNLRQEHVSVAEDDGFQLV